MLGQLLRNFAAHPAALAAASEMASRASQQRQGALHLARWGVRWPGAQKHLERACQSKQGPTPWQRDQLAAGLAQLRDSAAGTACLASQKPSRPTQLPIAKALDENGTKLFSAGEIDVLKNEVKDKDLQALMLAILTDDAEPIDPKN